jgi:L-lactate dehydrogenase complex protein LldE
VTAQVALFATCLGDQFFADACADAVRLLRHLGVDVDVPAAQTCCGQPAYNSGHRTQAVRMARHTVGVFRDYEYVVLPSGSCAGMVRCFYPTLLGPAEPAHGIPRRPASTGAGGARPVDVGDLASRTFELAQFIVRVLGVAQLGRGLEAKTVAYHHGCHALRELGVRDEPLTLLRGCGAEVVEWAAAEECCGFGGLFGAKLPEVSAGMADRKLDTLPTVDLVTTADGGCLMQLAGRAARRQPPSPPFRHLASVLWTGVDG